MDIARRSKCWISKVSWVTLLEHSSSEEVLSRLKIQTLKLVQSTRGRFFRLLLLLLFNLVLNLL